MYFHIALLRISTSKYSVPGSQEAHAQVVYKYILPRRQMGVQDSGIEFSCKRVTLYNGNTVFPLTNSLYLPRYRDASNLSGFAEKSV